MSFDDEKELEQLARRHPRDRPKGDNRVEMDILLNLSIRDLKIQRAIRQQNVAQLKVLKEIRDLLRP